MFISVLYEKNRYQNCLTVSNIGLASILSDPLGKSAKDIMTHVLNSDTIDEDAIKSSLRKSSKKKSDAVIKSIQNSSISLDQKMKMNTALNHMEELDHHIQSIEEEIFNRLLPHADKFYMLCDIPGISTIGAMTIISEIGLDMSQFESSKQLCCWAGLTPTNNEFAGKKKSVRISRAGAYLKPILVQCALSAIKSKKMPYFAIKYNRIKKRRGHKKALIAIARMILSAIYKMLESGEKFNPCDFDEVLHPKPKTSFKINEQIAIDYLNSLVYSISQLA
ncbi:MAG: transposase, partial [Erysipelotrichaceae bacterium]